MRIYRDRDLTKRIETLDFGILPAGETKTYSFWLYNETDAHIKELEIKIDHDELSIIESPDELLPNASGELKIKWRPSITLKEGLKANLCIRGIELWG